MTVVWRDSRVEPREPRMWPVYAAVGIAVLLGIVGCLLALRMFDRIDRLNTAAPSALPRVGDDVRTSFGVVAVEYTLTVAPPHAHAPGGVTGGLTRIGEGRVPLEVKVALTNLRDHVVRYSPAQFRLRARHGGREWAPEHATIPAGTLQPHASIDALLTFVAPAGPRLLLAFHDNAQARPFLVDLGRARPPTVAGVHRH